MSIKSLRMSFATTASVLALSGGVVGCGAGGEIRPRSPAVYTGDYAETESAPARAAAPGCVDQYGTPVYCSPSFAVVAVPGYRVYPSRWGWGVPGYYRRGGGHHHHDGHDGGGHSGGQSAPPRGSVRSGGRSR